MKNERRPRELTSFAERESLPGFDTWLAANRSRFKPGSVNHILFMHDHDCLYPSGEPCTCSPGPDIKVMGDEPSSN